MEVTTGLYIHIPFCKCKCNYCDFNSHAGKESLAVPYFNALKKEISDYSEILGKRHITSIFIGGGTPSHVDPSLIKELMETVSEKLIPDNDIEVSIESNPGTLTLEKLQIYRSCGINRLSIGLQAWQDRLLKDLGRIHSSGEYAESIDNAVKAGFTNINADLIFGLPGQTLEDWEETIDNVLATGASGGKPAVTHLSCYSLKIEEDTVFGDRLAAGTLKLPEEELDREMYSLAIKKLAAAGFKQYEISNFALPGYECRHNLVYWKAQEYVGLGAGAHSYVDSVRYNNIYGIEDYIEAVGNEHEENHNYAYKENHQYIDKKEEISEFMILGLRLTEGVSISEFRSRFKSEISECFGKQIEELRKKGLLAIYKPVSAADEAGAFVAASATAASAAAIAAEGSAAAASTAAEAAAAGAFAAADSLEAAGQDAIIRLTGKGLDLANTVFMEFV
ncbi:MAG: oxygen-independent coproporphyrinogen III oxidase [Clostridiales bacterium]|nr:oxygen-independent coproporphyrinogen III oxidase [Clostridiales bacterium]